MKPAPSGAPRPPKVNYQLQTDRMLSALSEKNERPALLLHSCCGPCSSYVLEYLTRFFDVTVLFYGPNIQPREEYEKRLFYQKRVLEHIPAKLLDCEYDGEAFSRMAEGLEREPEGGARCTACFRLRMEKTARLAAENGYELFCTTLSVSPHKDAERINRIGCELAAQYGVRWLPSDFKKRGGYQRSIVLSRELGLYRQDYCGCLFSAASGREG